MYDEVEGDDDVVDWIEDDGVGDYLVDEDEIDAKTIAEEKEKQRKRQQLKGKPEAERPKNVPDIASMFSGMHTVQPM